MARLTDEQKLFIVTRLAMFDGLSEVSQAFKEEYDILLPVQNIAAYDPTRYAAKDLSKRWRDIFEETRKEFKEGKILPRLAQKEARVRELEKNYGKAMMMRNYVLANQTLEQIAKEMGESYTNRVRAEHSGPNGAPMQVAMTAVINLTGMPAELQKAAEIEKKPEPKADKSPAKDPTKPVKK
jgi:hypothetical protein